MKFFYNLSIKSKGSLLLGKNRNLGIPEADDAGQADRTQALY